MRKIKAGDIVIIRSKEDYQHEPYIFFSDLGNRFDRVPFDGEIATIMENTGGQYIRILDENLATGIVNIRSIEQIFEDQ